jgi:hypothetical protein
MSTEYLCGGFHHRPAPPWPDTIGLTEAVDALIIMVHCRTLLTVLV